MMPPYWKPIEVGTPQRSGCLNCPPKPGRLSFRYNPHPGFGFVALLKNGHRVGGTVEYEGTVRLIRDWDDWATGEPLADWLIEVDGPLGGVRYRRVRRREWLAVERSMGFA